MSVLEDGGAVLDNSLRSTIPSNVIIFACHMHKDHYNTTFVMLDTVLSPAAIESASIHDCLQVRLSFVRALLTLSHVIFIACAIAPLKSDI
jgi:hypothetical protein